MYVSNFSFVYEYGQGVIDLLDIKVGMSVVDLGCGNGQLTKQLSDMGMEVIGVDESEEMISLARKSYPEIKFVHADATSFTVDAKGQIALGYIIGLSMHNRKIVLHTGK